MAASGTSSTPVRRTVELPECASIAENTVESVQGKVYVYQRYMVPFRESSRDVFRNLGSISGTAGSRYPARASRGRWAAQWAYVD